MKNIVMFMIAANFGAEAAFAAPPAHPDNDKFSLISVFDYSARAADILSAPAATSEYETGPWTFHVAVPYAHMPTAGGLTPKAGHAETSNAAVDTLTDLGDTVAAVSYNIYSGKSSTFGIDLTGKVKLKTDTGLSFGQNDYAAQADAYQSFDRFTALGSLGYKVLGNAAGISITNKVVYGSFGGAYRLDDKMHGGIDLSLTQNPSLTADGHSELTAYVSRKIGKNFRAKGYLLKGFSNGSPDSSLGAQVHYGF